MQYYLTWKKPNRKEWRLTCNLNYSGKLWVDGDFTPQTSICAKTSDLGCQIYCNGHISAETTFHHYRAVHTTNLALSHLQVQEMDVSISRHCSAEGRTRSNVHILSKA